MAEDEDSPSLKMEKLDYVAGAAKAALGAVPFAGSLLTELVGTVIPNQRLDRIVRFAEILDSRLKRLEEDFVRAKLNEEHFSDLLEEGLRQAARSVSVERLEQIASLIENSLSSEDITHQESRHLLRILGELNDIEVIWLRFYLVSSMSGDEQFRQRHREILTPISRSMGAPPVVFDKGALQDSYKQHLVQLGLLEPRYKVDSKTKQPEFSRSGLKTEGYELTPLGRLLLREIGLTKSAEDA